MLKIRYVLTVLTLLSAFGATAETHLHLRTDLPQTLEDLLDRRASAMAVRKATAQAAFDAERALHRKTAQAALDPVADRYFDADARPRATETRLACASRDHAACAELGLMYAEATGTWRDEALGFSLIFTACDAGDDIACEVLRDREWST